MMKFLSVTTGPYLHLKTNGYINGIESAINIALDGSIYLG